MAKPVNSATPAIIKGKIRRSEYRSLKLFLYFSFLLGDGGKNLSAKSPLRNAKSPTNQRGSSNDIVASPLNAGPTIEPKLFAAPAAPIPLVRDPTSVISAM